MKKVETPLANLLKGEYIAAENQKKKYQKNNATADETRVTLVDLHQNVEHQLLRCVCDQFEATLDFYERAYKTIVKFIPQFIRFRATVEIEVNFPLFSFHEYYYINCFGMLILVLFLKQFRNRSFYSELS